MKRINRRDFLSKSTICMAGVGIAGTGSSYSRETGNQKLSQGITVYHYKDCSHRKGYPGNSFFQGEKVTGET